MICLGKFFALSEVEANNFLKENAWWIALSIAGAILVVLVTLLLLKPRKKKEKKSAPPALEQETSLAALGGRENVLEHARKGRRIEISLRDASKVDQEALKAMGVSSFVLMSNKLTLVVESDPEKVEEAIFGK